MARVDYFHDPNAPKANSLRPAVSAFVQDSTGRLLMIRRTDNDMYAIPGGQQDVGETLSQAVVREVKEETGVDVEVNGLIGLYSNPNHVIAYDDGEIRQEFSICFRARPVGGMLSTSSETKEVLWLEPQQINDLNVHPSIRLRLQHGFADSPAPFFT
ncbi:NUDIX domain-containing protein [Lentzea sp. NPDC003310]|uniref:NUDIX hydrolase n=1 Tax=Lentzea sp. NPDC003310 TaxID=3154447 RepID=UPI00339F8936